jgi:hypothetical protein
MGQKLVLAAPGPEFVPIQEIRVFFSRIRVHPYYYLSKSLQVAQIFRFEISNLKFAILP